MYIFSYRIYSEPFSFNFGATRYYLDFFDSDRIRISVFYMREHIELLYILLNRVEKGIFYLFWQIIFRAFLLLLLGCPDNIYIFFDLLKYTISVFYMREHIELVYILQNSRIGHCILFLTHNIKSNFAINIRVPR